MKIVKAAFEPKQTFLPIKESMDKALLDEIEQLKTENNELKNKYEGAHASLLE